MECSLKLTVVCIAFLGLFGFSPSTSPSPAPWSFDGHRVVCEIAWQEMTSDARAEARRLSQLLMNRGQPYRTFAESCTWADTDDARDIHNEHWLDTAEDDEEVGPEDCLQGCVVGHLLTEIDRLTDPGSDDESRAEALAFVAHFVADIHQPLHVGHVSDQGGNRHDVRGLPNGIDTLHEVWDRYLLDPRASDWREYGAELAEEVWWFQRWRWRESDPYDWANESHQIVEDFVYTELSGVNSDEVSNAYHRMGSEIVVEQLKKAGVRLGRLLNQVLG